jgi:hypothetical protein
MLHVAQGLRERNWTSECFREDAEPWKIEFFEDSGRLMMPSWSGFRATVTKTDGSMCWVNMPYAGAETYTQVGALLAGRLTCYSIMSGVHFVGQAPGCGVATAGQWDAEETGC